MGSKSCKFSLVPNQSGQVAFYAIVVLPLLFSFSVLAVDVSSWQVLRNEAQLEADKIALHSAKFLPDKERAINTVKLLVSKLRKFKIAKNHQGLPEVFVDDKQVRVTLSAVKESVFDIFLNDKQLFEVYESAIAQLVPTDYVFILSNSGGIEEAGSFRELKDSVQSLLEKLSLQSTNRISLLFTPGVSFAENYSVLSRLSYLDSDSYQNLLEQLEQFSPSGDYHDVEGQNIILSLDQAYQQLLLAKDETNKRGNFKDLAERKVILISEFIPNIESNEFIEILSRYNAAGIELKIFDLEKISAREVQKVISFSRKVVLKS